MKQTLLDFNDLMDEGIPNPFYDPYEEERERLYQEELDKDQEELDKQRVGDVDDGLEFKICCSHVSPVDGSAYAVEVLDGYNPKYIVYTDGLPKGVEPKRCDCKGKCDGWRGGELVNQLYDRDGGCIDE